MQDLAARVAPGPRPVVLGAIGGARARLRARRLLFATIHRAENREPEAMRAWAALLGAVAPRRTGRSCWRSTRDARPRWRRPGSRLPARRARRRAAGLPHDPGAAAPRRGDPHRLRRRAARGGLAAASPCLILRDRPSGSRPWRIRGPDGDRGPRRGERAVGELARLADPREARRSPQRVLGPWTFARRGRPTRSSGPGATPAMSDRDPRRSGSHVRANDAARDTRVLREADALARGRS